MAKEKVNKGTMLNIRIEEDVKQGLIRLAELDKRTLSDYIRIQLEELVKRSEKQ